MEFREVLRRRRMHRAFLPDPIPDEQIARIANVIRHSPSGGFSQGGSVVVVTDPTARTAIARAFTDDDAGSADSYIATAPVHLVISANESLYHARYNEADKLAVTGGVELEWPVPYWFVDAGALMMAVLMAAIDEGLASAFIGHSDQKRVLDELLGLPPEIVPIGVALIGKPGDAPDIGSRLRSRRRDDGDLVHWGRW
jgi:nitroreductase